MVSWVLGLLLFKGTSCQGSMICVEKPDFFVWVGVSVEAELCPYQLQPSQWMACPSDLKRTQIGSQGELEVCPGLDEVGAKSLGAFLKAVERDGDRSGTSLRRL